MPYTVVISSAEAEVAKTAGVGEVEGTLFTYDPKDSMAVMAKLGTVETDASLRLAGRIATLLGRSLAKGGHDAPRSAQPQVDLEELFSAPVDHQFVEEAPVVAPAPKRRAKANA